MGRAGTWVAIVTEFLMHQSGWIDGDDGLLGIATETSPESVTSDWIEGTRAHHSHDLETWRRLVNRLLPGGQQVEVGWEPETPVRRGGFGCVLVLCRAVFDDWWEKGRTLASCRGVVAEGAERRGVKTEVAGRAAEGVWALG